MKNARIIPLVVFALTLIWYLALAVRYPTHGAIGTDPATYVQMALDLAQRGTVVHEFPLFTKLFERGFSWDAFITPGYHIVRETGFVAPNFAFGFPLLLAIGYRVFGENALYWTTPLLGALSLVMTFALANELFRNLSSTRRYWIGALAVLLLATTPKQIQLALVPMSDVPTQLFCALVLWGALRLSRPDRFLSRARHAARNTAYDVTVTDETSAWKPVRSWTDVALCGLSLGIAYLIRHSAIVLLIPLAVVAMSWGETRREKLFLILVGLIVFALTVAPDIFYRANVLGSPFAVESPESTQTNFYDAPRQIFQMLAALFSVTGFGPILLAALAMSIISKEKENRFAGIVLSAWILAFVLFHAPLFLTGVFGNNLRYLLPVYPALALLTARGMVALFDWGANAVRAWRAKKLSQYQPTRWDFALLCAIVTSLLFFLAIRALISPERFVLRAYGWMSETARADMNALNEQLPRDAVIGVSDQMAGATLLYAQRDIFRPNNFLEPAREFPQFLEGMKDEKRAVYLLGEWKCVAEADASERLPAWLGEYETGDLSRTELRDWELEIRGLPYACAQRVYSIQE